jgi:hypothetical protein
MVIGCVFNIVQDHNGSNSGPKIGKSNRKWSCGRPYELSQANRVTSDRLRSIPDATLAIKPSLC